MYSKIRNSIPRLLEVRDGIFLEAKEDVIDVTEEIVFCKGKLYQLKDNHLITELGYPLQLSDKLSTFFNVIGHPISLLDVLEYLRIKFPSKVYYIDCRGNLKCEGDFNFIPIDLSNPYIDGQSDELFNFIDGL